MGQLYNMPPLKAQEISWEMAVDLKSEVVDDYQKAAFSGYSRAAACVNPHQFWHRIQDCCMLKPHHSSRVGRGYKFKDYLTAWDEASKSAAASDLFSKEAVPGVTYAC